MLHIRPAVFRHAGQAEAVSLPNKLGGEIVQRIGSICALLDARIGLPATLFPLKWSAGEIVGIRISSLGPANDCTLMNFP
jgi:hypothetical protein